MSTTIIIAKANDAEKAMAVLTAMGIQFTTESAKAKTTKDQPKADGTKKQTSKKSDDNFDRKAYESISREFNCWSEKRNTCYKKCRDTVYAVMNGTMTKAKGKTAVKNILKTEYGIK